MRRGFLIIFAVLILIFLSMRLFWQLEKSTKLNVLILDKTVLNDNGFEHASLLWILKHMKFIKPDETYYSIDSDYFGFFPIVKSKEYKIKDLSNFSKNQLDSISQSIQMAYYTDNYGIYENEWLERKKYMQEHSRKIYGGLDENDLYLMQKMISLKKLFIGEFNLMATPTPTEIRKKAEDTLSIKWSGWTLRYYHSLDTIENKELPRWAINLYQREHGKVWPFKKDGIIFVNEDERLCVLENDFDISNATPQIFSTITAINEFNVPAIINYPYWADIISSNDTVNETLATYKIQTTKRGDSILNHYNIPNQFPAMIRNIKTANYYYLAGDFCDNNLSLSGSNFKGIEYINRTFRDRIDKNNRKPFFWCYYLPLVTKILNDNFKNNK